MKKQYLAAGEIVGTHGVRGEIRVLPWCDSPDFLTAFSHIFLTDTGLHEQKIRSARVHKSLVLLSLEGVDTLEKAEHLRGNKIYVNRDECDIGDHFFIEDLIGCTVTEEATGAVLGVLTDVSRTGANDVWHITRNGKEYLVPAIRDVVRSVDPDTEQIVIAPLKGIFDDAD